MESQLITITHFINPQLFWYHKAVDVPNEDYIKLKYLEQKMQEYYNKAQQNESMAIELGAKVAVFYLPWNKYLRCFIKYIKESTIQMEKAYIVWAMDYGFPIRTKEKYIRLLPQMFSIHINHIRRGGVANVMPVYPEFDFGKMCFVSKVKDHWSNTSCALIEKLLSNAASISFTSYFCIKTKCNWGKLIIKMHSGDSIIINDSLVEGNLAKPVDGDFSAICEKLICTKIPQYLSNNREFKFKDNILSELVLQNSDQRLEHTIDYGDIQDKIETWWKQNDRKKNDVSPNLSKHSCFSAKDIDFDDSVSNSEVNCVGLGGGALRKTLMQKYASGENPLPPHPEHFQISDPNMDHKADKQDDSESKDNCLFTRQQNTDGHIGSRTEYIRKLRRKFVTNSTGTSDSDQQISSSSNPQFSCDTPSNSITNSPFEPVSDECHNQSSEESQNNRDDANKLITCMEPETINENDNKTQTLAKHHSSRLQRLRELRALHCSNTATSVTTNDSSTNNDQDVQKFDSATSKSGASNGNTLSMLKKAAIEKFQMPETDTLDHPDITSKNIASRDLFLPAGCDLARYKQKKFQHRANSSRTERQREGNSANDKNQNFRFTRSHIDKIKTMVPSVDGLGPPVKSKTNDNITVKNAIISDHKISLRTCLEFGKDEEYLPVISDNLILEHATSPCNPISSIAGTFSLLIENEMSTMNFRNVKRLQAYAWPQILSDQSVLIISPNGSGRTWCYMPPLCHLLQFHCETTTRKNGPVAIVIVTNSRQAEIVASYCNRMLPDQKKYKIVAGFGYRGVIDTKVHLMNGCTILVATLSYLQRLLKENKNEPLINSKNLKHIVIDDLDKMLAHNNDTFKSVMKDLRSLINISKIQLIVVSQEWNPIMKSLMMEVRNPVLLFGDFIEAAVYSNVNYSMKIANAEEKINTIAEFLSQNSLNRQRTIIFCNSDTEVKDLSYKMTRMGFNCLRFYSSLLENEKNMMHHWKRNESYFWEILICTDEIFPELDVTMATNIVHYSMSTSWTKLTRRFAAMRNSFPNQLRCKDFKSNYSRSQLKSLIVLDEQNSIEVPCLVDFLKRHYVDVQPDLLTLSKQISLKLDQNRIILCPYLLEFGDCIETRCTYRHQPSVLDLELHVQEFPNAEAFRIVILKVLSPTTFIARLLEYKTFESTKWNNLQLSINSSLFNTGMNLHYANPKNCQCHRPLKVNDLCVFRDDKDFYRAQIMEVEQTSDGKIIKIKLILIDLSTIITLKEISNILVLDSQFRDFPAQAYHIHLLGVVPHDKERIWDRMATNTVHHWIVTNIKQNNIVQVDFKFSLFNHIWVSNLMILEQLSSRNHDIQCMNLKRSLIEKNFGVYDDNVITKICTFIEKYQLKDEELEEPEIPSDLINFSISEEYQNQNNTNDLMSFSTSGSIKEGFNVQPQENDQPQKYNQLSGSSENKENSEQTISAIEVANISMTDSLKELDVLFKPVKDSLPNNDQEINKNKLFIKEEWAYLTLDKLVKVNINETYCNWNSMFIHRLDRNNINMEDDLQELILDYVNNASSPPRKLNENGLMPFLDCILWHETKYERAKIYALYRSGANRICRFFLCDTGSFVTCNWKDLAPDSLYESTKDIIELMPFQAIHCTLGGIRVHNLSTFYQLSDKTMVAFGIRESPTRSSIIKDLTIHSYEILLYEWDEKDAWETATFINRMLVDTNSAVLDDETKHYLEQKVHLPCEEEQEVDETLPQITTANICPAEEIKIDPSPSDEIIVDELLPEEEKVDASVVEKNDDKKEEPRVVTFEELMRCFEAHIQMESDSGTYTDDEPNICEIENEDYLKAICASSSKQKTEKELSISGKDKENIPPATKKRSGNNTESSRKEKENVSSSVIEKEENDSCLPISDIQNEYEGMPALTCEHKRPATAWYQTNFFICLQISAPDIDDYHLEVKEDSLKFFTIVREEPHALFLNLMGTVDPKWVAHGIRGLKVFVHLKKSIPIKWPRLIYQTQKFPWLTYDIGFYIENESYQVNHNWIPEPEFNQGKLIVDYDDSSDDDSDIKFDKLTTANNDDKYDPLLENF